VIGYNDFNPSSCTLSSTSLVFSSACSISMQIPAFQYGFLPAHHFTSFSFKLFSSQWFSLSLLHQKTQSHRSTREISPESCGRTPDSPPNRLQPKDQRLGLPSPPSSRDAPLLMGQFVTWIPWASPGSHLMLIAFRFARI